MEQTVSFSSFHFHLKHNMFRPQTPEDGHLGPIHVVLSESGRKRNNLLHCWHTLLYIDCLITCHSHVKTDKSNSGSSFVSFLSVKNNSDSTEKCLALPRSHDFPCVRSHTSTTTYCLFIHDPWFLCNFYILSYWRFHLSVRWFVKYLSLKNQPTTYKNTDHLIYLSIQNSEAIIYMAYCDGGEYKFQSCHFSSQFSNTFRTQQLTAVSRKLMKHFFRTVSDHYIIQQRAPQYN
jgi:hypothetical protein